MYELQLLCQYIPSGIRILQGFGDLTLIHVPDTIQNMPVTEIGPYCFSATEPVKASDPARSGSLDQQGNAGCPNREQEKHPVFSCSVGLDDSFCPVSEKTIEGITLRALKGRYLEEIHLPASVEVLHNAAFYNCRKLHTLGIGDGLHAIGSDEFTNCTRLGRIYYAGSDKTAAGLSLLLSRLEMDLEVYFIPKRSRNPAQAVVGALFFPEYYEWLDEVTPAHLFSRSIHGEGFRMRKCFQEGTLSYSKYDACFDNALKTESPKTLCRVAAFRLLWPAGLNEANRNLYEKALSTHYKTALELAVSGRNIDLLDLTDSLLSADSNPLDQCIRADWGEGAAFLMEKRSKRKSFAEKSFAFEDF